MINENEYRIFGMRRSGNHMIVSAIVSCFGNNEVYYFNDIDDPHKLFATAAKTFSSLNKDKFGNLANKLVHRDKYYIKNIVSSKKQCLIQTYEDKNLSLINKIDKQLIGKSINKYNIIILRDCFNWLASRLQHVNKHNVIWTTITKNTIALWKQYAREFLGETNYFGNNKILINYNKFVTDEDYRKEIAAKLNLDYAKMSTDHVLGFGRGSSFTGTKANNNKDSYNERWKLFKNNAQFKELISDPEMILLSNKIFGPVYG
jgi:hypothetical protein